MTTSTGTERGRRTTRGLIWLGVMTAIGTELLGCGASDEQAAPPPDPPVARAAMSPATTPVPVGFTTPTAGSPPAGEKKTAELPPMPEDVPLYPEATRKTGVQVGNQVLGGWKTADAPTLVTSFYAEKLPDMGWTIAKNDSSAAGGTIHATKDGRKLEIAITRALPEGAVVNINHQN